jgi:hypothetical protein
LAWVKSRYDTAQVTGAVFVAIKEIETEIAWIAHQQEAKGYRNLLDIDQFGTAKRFAAEVIRCFPDAKDELFIVRQKPSPTSPRGEGIGIRKRARQRT